MPVDHYENFPVASWLLPARLREPVEAIYAFARGADDIADEGDLSDAARLRGLERYRMALAGIEAGVAQTDPPFKRLADSVAAYRLPIPLLRDLIDAFSQDVAVKRYATFTDLMDYARRSANPVGRLVLHLVETLGGTLGDRPPIAEDETVVSSRAIGGLSPKVSKVSPRAIGGLSPKVSPKECSDLICSGLQIVNFWQDVAVDWKKGRVYIPQEDLERFEVTERDIEDRCADIRWQRMMTFECDRARKMLLDGAPLGRMLPGRVGLEIRATVQGGLAILDKIEARRGDVFRHRPVLTKWDWVRILPAAL